MDGNTVQTLSELISGVDFTVILTEIKALIPVILPVTLGLAAFSRGWHFLKSQLYM